MEYDRTYNPIQTDLVTNPPLVHDCVIELPNGPGLGVEIDWDFVADHPYTGEIGIGAGSRPAFGLAHRGHPGPLSEIALVMIPAPRPQPPADPVPAASRSMKPPSLARRLLGARAFPGCSCSACS